LPTTLPHHRRKDAKCSPARLAFDVLFNGAMLASALIFAIIVLEREQRYALAEQQLANQTLLQRAIEPTAKAELIPPSD